MYTIRKAITHDIPSIKNVNEECLTENYDVDTYVKHIELYHMTYVVELTNADEPDVVGYIMGRIEDDVEAHVTSLAVAPAHRNNKLGSRLLIALLVDAKNRRMKSCSLQVRRGNDNALKLYKRLNFQPIRELSKYYEDGEDGIFMRRQLL